MLVLCMYIDVLQNDCNNCLMQFSSKVATAFECREYIKRKKVSDCIETFSLDSCILNVFFCTCVVD